MANSRSKPIRCRRSASNARTLASRLSDFLSPIAAHGGTITSFALQDTSTGTSTRTMRLINAPRKKFIHRVALSNQKSWAMIGPLIVHAWKPLELKKKLTLRRLVVGSAIWLFLALIGIWLFWIFPSTFFNALTTKIYLVTSTVLAAAGFTVSVRRHHPRLKYSKRDLLYGAAGIWCLALAAEFVLFSVLIYFSSSIPGSYNATYQFDSGNRECTGLKVYDQELDRRIKICQARALREGGKVRVVKLSGPLGIVVQDTFVLYPAP